MTHVPTPDLERILDELARSGVRVVLVGGLGARLRGAAVVTEDVDVVYSRDPANLDRLARWIADVGVTFLSRPDLAPQRSHLESAGHQLTVTPWGRLDLLGSAGAGREYAELSMHADPLDATTPTVLVAALDDIIRLKEEAGRPKDLAILPLLRSIRDETCDR